MTDTNKPRWRPLRHRKAKNPDGSMSLVEHIVELRRRLVISIVAFVLGTIIGYIWYQNGINITAGPIRLHVPTLGDVLRGPYCSLPASQRAVISADGECKLLATGVFDMFMLRLKVGALAGVVFSSPVWLWQLWRFVTPGLYKKERRFTLVFITIAVVLFVTGALLAYYIVAVGLEFLLSLGDQTQTAALNGLQYYNFLLMLLVIFGLSFEVPLFIVMLNKVGVLPYEAVKNKRRIIILGIFLFAAVATPGQDPLSMAVLGTALVLLVEMAFQICRFNDRKKVSERPDWLDVDDEAASALTSGPGGLGAAEPIAPAEPVHSSPLNSSHPDSPYRPSPVAGGAPGTRPTYPSPGGVAAGNPPGSHPTGSTPPGPAPVDNTTNFDDVL